MSFHESNASCLRTTDTKQNAITSAKLMIFGFIADSNHQRVSIRKRFYWLSYYMLTIFERYRSNSLKAPGPAHHHNVPGPHAPYHPNAAARSISAAM